MRARTLERPVDATAGAEDHGQRLTSPESARRAPGQVKVGRGKQGAWEVWAAGHRSASDHRPQFPARWQFSLGEAC